VAAGVSSLSCLDVDPPLAGGAGGARAALYARFGRPVTLQQCLATHTSPETMDVADARYCGTCQVPPNHPPTCSPVTFCPPPRLRTNPLIKPLNAASTFLGAR
jgi:hypothetical protein